MWLNPRNRIGSWQTRRKPNQANDYPAYGTTKAPARHVLQWEVRGERRQIFQHAHTAHTMSRWATFEWKHSPQTSVLGLPFGARTLHPIIMPFMRWELYAIVALKPTGNLYELTLGCSRRAIRWWVLCANVAWQDWRVPMDTNSGEHNDGKNKKDNLCVCDNKMMEYIEVTTRNYV